MNQSPADTISGLSANPRIDWSDLRIFLLVASLGTAKTAAHLQVNVTTVRRRVAALEHQLGQALLVRNARSSRLTAEGERVRAVALGMDGLAQALQADATDAGREIEGIVRISTMDAFGSAYLAPRLPPLLRLHPGISLQLVTAPHILNLADREADLSINMVRPRTGRLVVRKLAPFGIGLYGSRSYLKGRGTPKRIADLANHEIITYVDELVAIPAVRWLPAQVPSSSIRFSCTSLVAQCEAVRNGAGLAMLPHFLASRHTALVRLLPRELDLVRDWWLVVHQDLHRVPRIRAAIDYVASLMSRDRALLMGLPG